MSFGGDERGVSVVVGAVLMLGILVSALAMYQVNVVPDQNGGAEFAHNEKVTEDLVTLRNVVVDTGYENRTSSVSVPVGFRYDSRYVALDPPDPSGTLATNSTGDRQIEVAADGEVHRFNTSFLEYEPHYNEYTDAPTTVIEHGFVYDELGHVNLTRDAGSVVSDERVVIPLLEGELSETHSGAVSVTVETLDEYHVAEPDGDVTVRLPTNGFEAWNETFASYDVYEDDGMVVFEDLDVSEVLVAQIGVGDGRGRDDGTTDRLRQFGEPRARESGGGGAYAVAWGEEQTDSGVEDCDGVGCDEDYRVESGTDFASFVATADVSGRPSVDFSYRDPDGVGVGIHDADGEFTDGTADVEFRDFDGEGVLELIVYSGGSSDRITVLVEDEPDDGFVVTIDETNSPVAEGESLFVNATIQNAGAVADTQTIELEIDGVVRDQRAVTVGGGGAETVSLEWATQVGDEGTYTAVVSSDDHSDTTSVTIDPESGGGSGPPTVTSFTATEASHPNHKAVDVDFEAEAGGAGIVEAHLELLDGGVVTDEEIFTYGGDATVSENGVELGENHAAGEPRDVRLTVTDADGEETVEIIEDV